MSESSGTQWTLVDLMTIVMGVLMISALMMIVSMRPRRRSHHPMSNITQVRGITLGMAAYAGSNNGYYIGVNAKGELVDATVEYRYWLMLDQNYFSGNYVISPYDQKTAWTTGPVSSANYSYAMLKLDGEVWKHSSTGRRQEWRLSLSPEAAVMSDRNTGSDTQANVQSLQTTSPGSWQGQSVGTMGVLGLNQHTCSTPATARTARRTSMTISSNLQGTTTRT